MRVVLDTNVLLSALFTRGICEALLDACVASEQVTIVLSEHILSEFAEHATASFGAPRIDVRDTVGFLRRIAEIVEPAEVRKGTCRDPDDLPVLGTAARGRTSVVVTGDADLLVLRHYQRIPIVSPRVFYEGLRGGDGSAP